MAEHFLSADPTHSRWNRALAPHLTIDSGDTIHLECHDASGAQIRPGMTVEEFAQIDRNRIHALTGPVAIHNAQPGDVLQIDILEIAHKGWGGPASSLALASSKSASPRRSSSTGNSKTKSRAPSLRPRSRFVLSVA